MGIFDKKPFVGKADPLKKDGAKEYQPAKKAHSKDPSLFGGKSQVSKFHIHRALTKNPYLSVQERDRIKREFRLPNKWGAVDKEMAKIEERAIDYNKDGMITKSELERSRKGTNSPYWKKKRDLAEKMKGGITKEESWEVAREAKREKFFKDKFGLK